jgi:peptidoglycan-N-acetylglucosamine deacetylase
VRQVALSFDNGPDPDVTPRVLDVLRDRGAAAQFYVLGKHLGDPARRRLVERARDEGHIVGNHSFSHRTPLGEDPGPDAVEREIAATERLLSPLVPGPKRFRPFGDGGALGPHLLSPAAVAYLVAHQYSCILWNCVPRDWIDPDGWVQRAVAACSAQAHTLVVLHDIPNACLAGLEAFLTIVADRGMQLTLDVPPDCAPIVDGRVLADLSGIVAASDSGAARTTP